MSIDLSKPIETLKGAEAKVVVDNDNEIVIVVKATTVWYAETYLKEYKGYHHHVSELEKFFRNKKEKRLCVAYLNINDKGMPRVYDCENLALNCSSSNFPVRARRVEFEYEI